MKNKRCTGCNERKSIKDDFNKDKTTRDGKKTQCRDCTRKNRPSRARKIKDVTMPPERIKSNCMDRWWV